MKPAVGTFNTQAAFSPYGRLLAGSHEGGVSIWDLKTGRSVKTFPSGRRYFASVNFSSNGDFLCATAERGRGRIWNVSDWSQRCRLTNAGVRCGVLSPDDSQLATVVGKRISLFDTRTGELIRTISLPERGRDVGFSPDGKRLVATSGNRVRIFDTKTGQLVLTLSGHTGGVVSVAFSPDGRRIVSASSDGTVRIWGESPPAAKKPSGRAKSPRQ